MNGSVMDSVAIRKSREIARNCLTLRRQQTAGQLSSPFDNDEKLTWIIVICEKRAPRDGA